MESRLETRPVAVERAYALWLWLDARIVDLPVPARATLVVRVGDASLGLLDVLLMAAYEPRASAELPVLLRDAARRATLLRYLVRGMHERRYLSHTQHAFASDAVVEIGRMVGAWQKSLAR
jgi:hypothetical protein